MILIDKTCPFHEIQPPLNVTLSGDSEPFRLWLSRDGADTFHLTLKEIVWLGAVLHAAELSKEGK